MEPGVNRCALFNQWSQGKKSLLLNLTKPEGIAIAKELIRKSDVVVENSATGVMDQLGLGYEELKKIKPNICGTEEEWQALCHVIGQLQLATDIQFRTARDRKANEEELERLLTAWTEPRNKWEVTRTLQAAGVAAFPSMNSKDLAKDPQLNARGFFARLPHAEVGVQTHTGIPWLLTHAPNGVRAPAPLLGQDTDQVMHDVLGYSDQEIARLKEERVLY